MLTPCLWHTEYSSHLTLIHFYISVRFSFWEKGERKNWNSLKFSAGDTTPDKIKATVPTTKCVQTHEKLGSSKASKTLSNVRTLHVTSHAKFLHLLLQQLLNLSVQENHLQGRLIKIQIPCHSIGNKCLSG